MEKKGLTIRTKADILDRHGKRIRKEAYTMLKFFVLEVGKKQDFEGFLYAFGMD